ncbi:MAG: prepilin-type N-terminal cleavage/methylation domain-containing protein [Candidatus Atribacteria bacterium]|nr:prepilin-type N-terminal cleavage/methylation domain-containing protein [Candidatus Atribacteria bacterium]
MINILSRENQKGFSLIEMMVVVVILGLIILGLVTFFTGGARSWIAGQRQLEAQRNARQAIDRMVREIRHGEVVTTGTTTSITVTVPALGSEIAYDVNYNLIGTTINRDGNPLINNVKTLSFGYPDTSKVHILLEVDVDDDGNPDITLNTDVNLRNFGLQ